MREPRGVKRNVEAAALEDGAEGWRGGSNNNIRPVVREPKTKVSHHPSSLSATATGAASVVGGTTQGGTTRPDQSPPLSSLSGKKGKMAAEAATGGRAMGVGDVDWDSELVSALGALHENFK